MVENNETAAPTGRFHALWARISRPIPFVALVTLAGALGVNLPAAGTLYLRYSSCGDEGLLSLFGPFMIGGTIAAFLFAVTALAINHGVSWLIRRSEKKADAAGLVFATIAAMAGVSALTVTSTGYAVLAMMSNCL